MAEPPNEARTQARERLAAVRADPQDMTWLQFRNLICAFRFIARADLRAAGIIPETINAWHGFQLRPTDFFLTLPDDQAARLFDLLRASV